MPTLYELLEVSEQATPDDLRRAYRRLVLLTHPDRTPDAAAHQRYLVVNEAYEILSQPARRQAYDALLQRQRQPPAATEAARPLHRDPALRRQGQQRPPLRRAVSQVEQYGHYAPAARWICRLTLAFIGLLLLDFCWLERLPDEVVQRVESVTIYARGRSMDSHEKVQTTHTSFRSDSNTWPEGTHLMIDRTMLFQVFRQAAPVGHPELMTSAGGVSIYGNFIFLPFILALLAATGLWRASTMRSINCAIGCIFLFPIILYILAAT